MNEPEPLYQSEDALWIAFARGYHQAIEYLRSEEAKTHYDVRIQGRPIGPDDWAEWLERKVIDV